MSRSAILHLVAAACLGFALSVHAGSRDEEPASFLRVVVTPPEANVTVDGEQQVQMPITLTNLVPGTHLIIANYPGYSELRRSIELGAGQRTVLQLQMEKLGGLLLLHSTPAGADVQVSGSDRGRTPCLLTDLPFGKHKIRFSKTGYLPRELEIDIADRVPQKLAVDLTSDSATLVLNSVPPGAQVTLNSISRGQTPCRLDKIPAGESVLEMSIDGYEPYRGTLKLAAGEIQELSPRLTAKPSDIRIVSIPEKARIYVNNQFQGEAPVDMKNLAPGSYRIRAELSGFEVLARSIELKQASHVVEEFRLQSNAGSLQVTTEPAGVQVFVNGQDKGATTSQEGQTDRISEPFKVELLPPGTYEIRLEKKGYAPATEKVTVERDKTATLQKALVRRFIPDCEVRTATDVHRGVLLEVDPAGNVKLEVRPGIVKTIPAADVRARIPIREDNKP